jgi:excisionase family DNA binding protein
MQTNPIALKISEACSAARVGRTCLYEAIKSGELRALKRGKSTLILRDDLVRWIEGLPPVNANLNPAPRA